jgi:hypothetical protein
MPPSLEAAWPQAGSTGLLGPRHGVSVEALLRVVSRETERILKEADGDHRQAWRLLLELAESAGVYSDADLPRVRTALDIAADLEAKRTEPTDAVHRLEELCSDALLDPASTPTGLATLDAIAISTGKVVAFGGFAIIGAVVGGLLAGEVGIAVGAAVGWLVATILTKDDDDD